MEAGTAMTDNEACLSCKVFIGHCARLIDRAPDLLFVPRYMSLDKGQFCCPKFFALADVVACTFPGVPLFSPRLDANKERLATSLVRICLRFTKNPFRVRKAIAAALEAHAAFMRARRRSWKQSAEHAKPRILVISHPYNLHDRYVNMALFDKLGELGVAAVPSDAVPLKNEKDRGCMGWDFGSDMLAQVDGALAAGIHGALQLTTFNCGCDAVLMEFVEEKCRAAGTPYMALVIDEHTGDAGILTRLEAFIDTLPK